MVKGRFSKIIISLVILMNIIFTTVVLAVFAKVESEPVALIGSWFAFTTGELWMLASIKKSKVKKGVLKDESDQLETKTDK